MVFEITTFFASRIWRHRDLTARRRFTRFFMTDSDRATTISWQISKATLYLGCMVSEIIRFYCKPDMTSSWFLSLVALQMILHDRFWKSEHDLLIVIHSNFLFVMHGFRHNEVLLQAGYDVTVISPLGGASGEFSWRILNEWPWLPDSVS